MYTHVRTAGSNNCFGTRSKVNGAFGPYEWITYAEADTRIKNNGCVLAGEKSAEGATRLAWSPAFHWDRPCPTSRPFHSSCP